MSSSFFQEKSDQILFCSLATFCFFVTTLNIIYFKICHFSCKVSAEIYESFCTKFEKKSRISYISFGLYTRFLSAYIWLYMQQLSAAKRVSQEIPKIDNDKTLLYS